jgi:catechol 2,3-dioxygenase-like lactoylglutathione lyase family enzyme
MKRMHIHLSVADLNEGIRFYSGMFAAQPTVVKEDYAKWMLDGPRVNFAISSRGADRGLNHLGIQVESEEELDEMRARLTALQPDLQKEKGVACCYAKADKYWVHDPTGIAWETFQTLATIPVFGESDKTDPAKEACCVPLAKVSFEPKSEIPCCVPLQASQSGSEKCC